MRQLLRNERVLLQNAIVVTKRDVYYKMRRYSDLPNLYTDKTYTLKRFVLDAVFK